MPIADLELCCLLNVPLFVNTHHLDCISRHLVYQWRTCADPSVGCACSKTHSRFAASWHLTTPSRAVLGHHCINVMAEDPTKVVVVGVKSRTRLVHAFIYKDWHPAFEEEPQVSDGPCISTKDILMFQLCYLFGDWRPFKSVIGHFWFKSL